MKNLLGVLSCLIAAAALAMAQQGGESKAQPPGLQPAGEVLVKALLAADNAQKRREAPSAEDLRKTIDREIARLAAGPLTPTPQTAGRRPPKPTDRPSLAAPLDSLMVLIDGAVYYRFDGMIYPAPGGGASGCFAADAEAKVQKARIKFAEQLKAEQEKAVEGKKD